jgi:hypothetical protein
VTTTRSILAVLLVALVLAACGGNDATTTTVPVTSLPEVTTSSTQAGTTTTASSTTTTTTTTLPPSPLNGMGVADLATLDRRVVAIKIDNHPDARPQSGIEQADAVYELLVEGGLTRFIALFHSSDTEYLGPVRSGRPTDPTLIKFLGAPLQISGAQPWVVSLINSYGVKLLGDNGNTTFRISSRHSPHNLYGSTILMREEADRRGYPDDPPPPMFDFGDPTPGTTPATDITLDWSNAPVVRWEWDGTQYLRFNAGTPHNWVTKDGVESQIAVDTLVVLEARRYTASSKDGSGSAVPAEDTVGEGAAYVFYDGVVVEGRWQRDSIDERFELSLPDGTPIVVPAGRIWISVFPSQQEITWE